MYVSIESQIACKLKLCCITGDHNSICLQQTIAPVCANPAGNAYAIHYACDFLVQAI
jgi:hypothetical protein